MTAPEICMLLHVCGIFRRLCINAHVSVDGVMLVAFTFPSMRFAHRAYYTVDLYV